MAAIPGLQELGDPPAKGGTPHPLLRETLTSEADVSTAALTYSGLPQGCSTAVSQTTSCRISIPGTRCVLLQDISLHIVIVEALFVQRVIRNSILLREATDPRLIELSPIESRPSLKLIDLPGLSGSGNFPVDHPSVVQIETAGAELFL